MGMQPTIPVTCPSCGEVERHALLCDERPSTPTAEELDIALESTGALLRRIEIKVMALDARISRRTEPALEDLYEYLSLGVALDSLRQCVAALRIRVKFMRNAN